MNAVLKTAPYRELLLGMGHSKVKRIKWTGVPQTWENLTTLDMDPKMRPDVVHDLNVLPYPFETESYDEIHAYEVLEHCGRQGDAKYFFGQFAEFYRILKPGGFFCFTVPMWDSPLAWGVPDHTRCMPKDLFIFLNPAYYNFGEESAEGKADYRELLGDTHFEICNFLENEHSLAMILRAVK